MTIRHAGDLAARIGEALDGCVSVVVDTTGLRDVDTSILQLLCSLHKTAPALSFHQPSAEFLAAVDRCGLRRELLGGVREDVMNRVSPLRCRATTLGSLGASTRERGPVEKMSADIMERMRVAFRAEALDLLAELDTALLTLEAEPAGCPPVHRVFRAIHTIKGSGATAGFAHLARFSHRLEEAFDLAREGRLAVTSDLIDCGLKACDVIRAILDEEREEGKQREKGRSPRRSLAFCPMPKRRRNPRAKRPRSSLLPRAGPRTRLSSARTASCSVPERTRLRCWTS